jgi:high-affinity iron transporter
MRGFPLPGGRAFAKVSSVIHGARAQPTSSLWRCCLALAFLFVLPARTARADDADARSTDAAEVVHLLEYVGSDYGGAVQNGQVKNPDELEEQIEVLAEAGRVANHLVKRSTNEKFDPRTEVDRVRGLVIAHRSESDVAAAVKEARDALVAFYQLPEAPRELPSRERGQHLYELHCATCHGEKGFGDTPRAAEYTPRPANLHAPEVAGALSPLRVFTTVRFGVPNTSMVPFDFLSEAERWDLAFYASELDHESNPRALDEARVFALADLAANTDDELRDDLRKAGVAEADVDGALAYLRRQAPYDSATAQPKGSAMRARRARASLRKIEAPLARGDTERAKALLLSIYLDEIEPIEAPLRAADPVLVRDVEGLFKEIRADIDARAPRPEIDRKIDTLNASLARAARLLAKSGDERSFWTTAVSSAGIALREGAEAALLIAALLAVVARAGQSERKRWVHLGWISAALAGALTWFASRRIVQMSGLGRETLEGMSALLAAVVLFYVSYWLFAKRESARWIGYLKSRASAGRAALSLFGIAFLAVYREAFETVIFYQALISDPGSSAPAGAGALVGLALLVALVIAYGRAGKFAPPKSFFAFSTLLLYGLSVVFAGQGVAALQTTGLLPLHPVRLPQWPALGVFPTIETYAVQALLVALAVAAFFVQRASRASAASPPPAAPREGAKL